MSHSYVTIRRHNKFHVTINHCAPVPLGRCATVPLCHCATMQLCHYAPPDAPRGLGRGIVIHDARHSADDASGWVYHYIACTKKTKSYFKLRYFISEVCNNDVDVTDSQAYILDRTKHCGLNIEKSLDMYSIGLFYTFLYIAL